MKTKLLQLLFVVAFMFFLFSRDQVLKAQTAGTLTCTFTTTFTGGSYGTKYLLAAWIETNSGTFVKTKLKYAKSSNYDHLQTWVNASGQNVVDAISSTTRLAPETLSFTWNGTNVSAAIVNDGVYKVWLEMAWGSSLTTGKTVQSFSFTKGAVADHQTASTTNFTGLVIDWVPATTSIADNEIYIPFSVSPNPVNDKSTINYSLETISDVTISLYDFTGKLIKVLFDDNQAAGIYRFPLSLKENVKAGVYFIRMYTGSKQHVERILISN